MKTFEINEIFNWEKNCRLLGMKLEEIKFRVPCHQFNSLLSSIRIIKQ